MHAPTASQVRSSVPRFTPCLGHSGAMIRWVPAGVRTSPALALDLPARSDPRPAYHSRRTGSDLMGTVLSGAPRPSPGVLLGSLPLLTGRPGRTAPSGRPTRARYEMPEGGRCDSVSPGALDCGSVSPTRGGGFVNPVHGSMVGREAELAVVRRFVGDHADGPASLTLAGEAGIGKTAIWAQALLDAQVAGRLGPDLPMQPVGCRLVLRRSR